MMRATRSELTRLRRRNMLLAWFGLTALFALAINVVVFDAAAHGTAPPDGGPGVSFPTAQTLAGRGGLVAGLASASSLFGVVTLSFWAIVTATDYSTGMIRLLVAAQPHRWRLLAGKVTGLALMTAVATCVALLANVVAAPAAARAAGVSTDAWGRHLASTLAGTWADLFCALLVWGVAGLVLAVLSRSSAVAISVGVGYVLVVESIVKAAAEGASAWLPGTTLSALAQGGTPTLSYPGALALGLAYGILGLGVAVAVLTRRDITD